MYRNERLAVLRGIDEKLYSGATGIGELFPDAYHAGITGKAVMPEAEYLSYVNRLTDLARKNGFQWLYTYMEVDGRIVIASTSADLSDNTHKPFLTVYEQPSANLRRAFAERKMYFDEYTDEYGRVRSAFVPFVTSNGKVFVAGSDVSIAFIGDLLTRDLRGIILISLVVSTTFVLLSVVVATRISRPIGELAALTKSLADRSFSLSAAQVQWLQSLSDQTRDEVGELGSAFIQMDAMLKTYFENLRQTTAAKERIESELNIARQIQDSFLHKLFPPFPDRTEFDLFAALQPAKEVGGDLYDFVLMGDELYFCVGDVSDKGVPAALLMVVTQTLMRAAAQQPDVDPAIMLARVNADILEKNEMMMFVTMFCGVLRLSTGELRYSNAGHHPPLIAKHDGSVEWLPIPEGVVLGVMPDLQYRTFTTTLAPGDTLIAYTDGVPEAHDPHAALYSDARLFEVVTTSAGSTPEAYVGAIMRSVKAHAGTAAQFDDLTVLALTLGHGAGTPAG
jgi:sigma-B regulation protein RsbU (phosphoserine phosphatase)